MGKIVNNIVKRIYKTRPTGEVENLSKSHGQYNYGKIDAEQANFIMGIQTDSLLDDLDLYSVVQNKYDANEDVERHPYGYMNGGSNPSDGRPSYIKFHHVISSTLYGDTDSDYWYHGHYSLWMYDGYESYGTSGGNAVGSTGNNKGTSIRWGLIGSGGDYNYIVYPNGSFDAENSDGDPLDGAIWKDKSPGHLLGSRALGEVDQQHTLVDSLYDKVDGSWHACGDWGAKAAQGLSGWQSWNKALPLEYCYGRRNTNFTYGQMYTGDSYSPLGKPSWWAAPGDWNSGYDPQHTGEWDDDDWTQFNDYLTGGLDSDYNLWYNGGHAVTCTTRYWSVDEDCNQPNDYGVITGDCPDESLPFYCGPGLALERFNDTDEGNTFTRGMTTELGVGTNKVEDFHLGWHQIHRPYNPPFNQKGPERLVPDGETFSDYVRGISSTEHVKNIISMVVVLGGDEREKIWGLEGKVDERDRQYTRINIPKNYLYEIWKNQKGEVRTFNFTYRHDGDTSNYWGTREKSHSTMLSKLNWENGWGTETRAHNYLDDRGELAGYIGEIEYFDDKLTATRLNHVRIKVKAPTFDPLISIKSIDQGGMNANWVDASRMGWWCINAIDDGTRGYRRGLNPKYDIDFVGFPSSFYQDSDSDGKSTSTGKYLKEPIPDFRPISYIEPINIPPAMLCTANPDLDSWTGQDDEDCAPYGDSQQNCTSQDGCDYATVDLQGYYDGSSINALAAKAYSSAPNDIKLYFRLADFGNTATPLFFDENPSLEEAHSDFKYWFFVVNWDWKEGDAGGGDCEESQSTADCIKELSETFPISDFELELLNDETEDLYKIVSITGEEGYDTVAEHQYVEPGVKIIKALVFATVDISSDYWGNSWCVDTPCHDYSNFRQAFHWKLITIKINLNGDGVFPSPDFGDLGGDDYVYLPMPDVMNLYEQGEAPSGNPYKSSHMIISGLSEESQYIKSLEEIYRADTFTKDEIDEKNTLYKARKSSPIGVINELGDYLGDSDLAQTRYFNKVVVDDDTTPGGEAILDMRKFLGIETIDLDGDFHPYNDFNYWSGTPPYEENNDIVTEPAFPKKSPVGDIFINDYNQFRELCLFEFNFGNLDGKSTTDSSGNGNKGILIGDYSITKEAGTSAIRESYIKIPEQEKDNGAF